MERIHSNVAEAERALLYKPMFATSVERVALMDELKDKGRELPQPARFAAFLKEFLGRVSVPLEPYDLIAGRCVDRELTDGEEAAFQMLLKHPDYPRKTFLFGSGHCTYSWDMLLARGLGGLRKRALTEAARRTDADEKLFLTSMAEVYEAIGAYILRYADAADGQGMTDLAACLRGVSHDAPRDFRGALQLLWIVTLINCAYLTPNPTLTVGRMDQLLLSYYRADLASGRMTPDDAAEYITDYYCKHNLIMGRGEHQVGDATNSTTFDRIYCFDAPQYLLLAGTDEKGAPAVNELTLLFARLIQPTFKNPVIVVRYYPHMNEEHPELWSILMEKALKSASMMFYNDDNVLRTLERLGIPEADARRYEHFGCNWFSLGDRGLWMGSTPSAAKFGTFVSEEERREICVPYMRVDSPHSWPEDFMLVFRELAAREDEVDSIESFYAGVLARMEAFLDRKLAHYARELTVRRRRPASILTFADCFLRGSLESASSCGATTATYHFQLQAFQMFGTVVDSFIVIDQLVFRQKRLTLSRLLRVVDTNFREDPEVLALCRGVAKYGSDDAVANGHVERLSEAICQLVREKNRPYLEQYGLFLTPCMQSDTWHLKYGEDFGATPDGRLANTPFSQNMRPSNGACTHGLTAMFNSMLHIPSDGLVSGSLNLDVDSRQFAGEEGRALFGAMLATYFNGGGLHAQVSCLGAEELKDAVVNPDAHRDLRVRVTGYSGIFVDMENRLQRDIINRFQ